MPVVTLENATDAFAAIVPLVRVSLAGTPSLIGTGFFISNTGLLVTARHVIEENIGRDGIDIGGIGVWHSWGKAIGTYRPLRTSQLHTRADIAVCEVAQMRNREGETFVEQTLSVSLQPELPGELVSSQFFNDSVLVPDASIANEVGNPRKQWRFAVDTLFQSASPATPETDGTVERLTIGARITQGQLIEYFPSGRDRVMLPFPVYSSNLPIYGGASGGPIFNTRGEVIAINCTRFEGSDISFHTALAPLLDFHLENTVIHGEKEKTRSFRELVELGFLSIKNPL